MLKKPVTRRDFVKGVAVGGSLIIGSSLLGCAEKKPTPTPTPGETPKPTPTAPKKPIKIGFLGPLSGPFVPWGTPHLKGAQMAVEEINQNGGVMGTQVELVARDTKNNPSESATAFEELVYDEGVIAVIGPVSSDVCISIARKAEELKVPLLLHMGGAEEILTKNSRYTFRTTFPPPTVLLRVFADYIENKGIKRVAAIVADYAWGHTFKELAEKYIKPLPEVELRIEVAPVRESNFTPYLRKFVDFDPELILATGHPPGTPKIAKQGMEIGLKAKYVGPFFPKSVWETALGDLVTHGILDLSQTNYESDAFKKFAERFAEKYNMDVDFAPVAGYVNVHHIAWAIKQADSIEPEKIANSIREGEYVHPLYAYPLSYTEWGDVRGQRVILATFKSGAPFYYQNAISHYEIEYISPPISPTQPV